MIEIKKFKKQLLILTVKRNCIMGIAPDLIREYISYNDLIYNIYNTPITIRHLITNIFDVLNPINMSDVELDFLLGSIRAGSENYEA